MARAQFQVVVYLFRRVGDAVEFALLRRSVEGYWQGIAGGGEHDETPEAAAHREAFEEAGLAPDVRQFRLTTQTTVPVYHFAARDVWGKDVYVIPLYYFAAALDAADMALSAEHSECAWFTYEQAQAMLHWDSDKTALWELNERLRDDTLK